MAEPSGSKRALIVQGGGMRGAYVVGVLSVLHAQGGAQQFDAIYGVSSGVYAATFFLADQVKTMIDTWENHVHDRRLINYRNVLRGRPVLDLDYMMGLFRGGVSHLEVARVHAAGPALYFVATDLDTGDATYIDAKRVDIFQAMRASSAVPGFHPPVALEGRRYFDGGASDPVPVARAIADGYTHLTVVATELENHRHPLWPERVQAVRMWRYPGARRALATAHAHHNHANAIIRRPPPGVTIDVFRPSRLVSDILTTNRSVLIEGIRQGQREARARLSIEEPHG